MIQEAYKCCKKLITEKEANEALRIVWGRSEQLYNDDKSKRKWSFLFLKKLFNLVPWATLALEYSSYIIYMT